MKENEVEREGEEQFVVCTCTTVCVRREERTVGYF